MIHLSRCLRQFNHVSQLAAKLGEVQAEYCRSEQAKIDKAAGPSVNAIYDRVFARAMHSVDAAYRVDVPDRREPGKTFHFYPARVENGRYQLMQVVVPAQHQSWRFRNGKDPFQEAAALPPIEVEGEKYNFRHLQSLIVTFTNIPSWHEAPSFKPQVFGEQLKEARRSGKTFLEKHNQKLCMDVMANVYNSAVSAFEYRDDGFKLMRGIANMFPRTDEGNNLCQVLFNCNVQELQEQPVRRAKPNLSEEGLHITLENKDDAMSIRSDKAGSIMSADIMFNETQAGKTRFTSEQEPRISIDPGPAIQPDSRNHKGRKMAKEKDELKRYVVGVDIGGTKIELGVFKVEDSIISDQLVYSLEQETQKGLSIHVKQVTSVLAEANEFIKGEGGTCVGVGIGSPGRFKNGIIKPRTNTILGNTPEEFDGKNVQELYTEALTKNVPELASIPIVVRNDGDVMLVGLMALINKDKCGQLFDQNGNEVSKFTLQEKRNIAYLGVGTGLGSADIEVDRSGNFEFVTDGHMSSLLMEVDEEDREFFLNRKGRKVPPPMFVEHIKPAGHLIAGPVTTALAHVDDGRQINLENDNHVKALRFTGKYMAKLIVLVKNGKAVDMDPENGWSIEETEAASRVKICLIGGGMGRSKLGAEIIKYAKEELDRCGFPDLQLVQVTSKNPSLYAAANMVQSHLSPKLNIPLQSSSDATANSPIQSAAAESQPTNLAEGSAQADKSKTTPPITVSPDVRPTESEPINLGESSGPVVKKSKMAAVKAKAEKAMEKAKKLRDAAKTKITTRKGRT